jgi:hypothetical protein
MFSVLTASAKMPMSCWGHYGKVAVVEHDPDYVPAQIHPNHKACKRIVRVWDRLHRGGPRSAFALAKNEAEALARELNEASRHFTNLVV